MNYFTTSEMLTNYSISGAKKTSYSALKTLILGFFGGALIALGGSAAATASFGLGSASLTRLVSGLLFPFGLAIIMLMSVELFTGNCLIGISVLEKKTTVPKMLKNLVLVYLSNFVGALFVAWCVASFGHLNMESGAFAVSTVSLAVTKCTITFGKGVLFGILCNFLVCLGVLCASCAKDVTGRILGAFVPVCVFVTCGFEHSIANMYYVPAGIFAVNSGLYTQALSHVDTTLLTWQNFFVNNLIPVTIGNIIGGVLLGVLLWYCHLSKKENKSESNNV